MTAPQSGRATPGAEIGAHVGQWPAGPRRVGPISDEPLVNFVHRWAPELVFGLYLLGMVYLSFVPFDLTPGAGAGEVGWTAIGLPMAGFNMPDILSNLLAYVPLGGFAYVVARRWRLGRLAACACAIGLSAATSYGVEFCQQYVGARVSSLVDFTSNTLGATLGIVGFGLWEDAFRRIGRRLIASAAHHTWIVLANVFLCAVLLVQLRPYDVVIDPVHTAYALRHADVSPMARWDGLRTQIATEVEEGRRVDMGDYRRARWEYLLDRLADTAAYGVTTMLVVLSLAARFGRRRLALHAWAGFVTISLACMIMLIRMFLVSHGLDTSQMACGLLGALLGSLGVDRFLRRIAPDELARRASPARVLSSNAVLAAAGGVAAMVLLYEVAPFDFGESDVQWSAAARSMNVIPFFAHFQSRPNDAVYDISGDVLRYAFLGAALALLLRRVVRWSWMRQLGATLLACTGVAALMQFLYLTSPTRFSDATTVLLGSFGAFVGAVGLRWLIDYHTAGCVVYVDDPLTAQLIEGKTYDKATAIRPRSSHSDASRTDQAESVEQR